MKIIAQEEAREHSQPRWYRWVLSVFILGTIILLIRYWSEFAEVAKNNQHAVALFSLATLLSLVFSIWQTSKAISESKYQQNLSVQLAEIADRISTRFLGQFPDFLYKIIDLINTAKSTVIIVCDFPAYGILSNPDSWIALDSAIRIAIRRGVVVRLICYAEEKRNESAKRQLSHYAQVDKQGASELRRLAKNVQVVTEDKAPIEELITQVQFALADSDKSAIKITFGGAKISYTEKHLPIFLWLVDHRAAIFTIPSFSDDAQERAFTTIDKTLLEALINMINEVEPDAKIPLK